MRIIEENWILRLGALPGQYNGSGTGHYSAWIQVAVQFNPPEFNQGRW